MYSLVKIRHAKKPKPSLTLPPPQPPPINCCYNRCSRCTLFLVHSQMYVNTALTHTSFVSLFYKL